MQLRTGIHPAEVRHHHWRFHLYLDPSGTGLNDLRLAQGFYKVPNLYDNLLEHYVALRLPGRLPE